MNYKEFTPDICAEIGYYVYRLIDPRNGETFYVGKGKNNRIFEHLKGKSITNEISDKIKRINDIHNQGLSCILIIHRHKLSENEALHVEAALIDAYPQLTNEVIGNSSSKCGIMTVRDIIQKYSLEEIPESEFNKHKVVIIKIGKSLDKGLGLYDATRYAWSLDSQRASEADYVLSVGLGGVIMGIFEVEKWLLATPENFPKITEFHNSGHYRFDCSDSGRYGFIGYATTNTEIINLYKNKKLPKKYIKKGSSNPIQYNY